MSHTKHVKHKIDMKHVERSTYFWRQQKNKHVTTYGAFPSLDPSITWPVLLCFIVFDIVLPNGWDRKKKWNRGRVKGTTVNWIKLVQKLSEMENSPRVSIWKTLCPAIDLNTHYYVYIFVLQNMCIYFYIYISIFIYTYKLYKQWTQQSTVNIRLFLVSTWHCFFFVFYGNNPQVTSKKMY